MKSPPFGILFICVQRPKRKRSSRLDMTGAKQSALVHECGSRFPRATIRYLARSGFPFSSVLILDMAMVGRGFPSTCARFWYSSSVM